LLTDVTFQITIFKDTFHYLILYLDKNWNYIRVETQSQEKTEYGTGYMIALIGMKKLEGKS